MLDLYRRHTSTCPHRDKGREWTKCKCPIWATGDLNEKPIRKTTKTRDWSRAAKRIAEWEKSPEKAISAPLLEKAISIYLQDCRARELASSTVDSYETTLTHLSAFCPKAHADDIDLGRLTEFR